MPLYWVDTDQACGDSDCAVVETPLGKFRMTARSGVLIDCNWADDGATLREPRDPLLIALSAELQRYWHNPAAADFSAPLLRKGSPFGQSVWQAMCAIPCGETRSYGEIAKHLHSAARAVGGACRNNPFTLLVPCHRIVSSAGLGGYSGERNGALTDLKRRLLQHEGGAL